MKNIYSAHKQELIIKTAEELKKLDEMAPPEWSNYVKTGVQKQRPPVQADWWYMRAASMLLKIMGLGPVGVSKLRTRYGGKKRRGHKPAEFRQASGSILRKILQQLEKAGLVKQVNKSGHKGRIMAPKGFSLLNTASKNIKKKVIVPKSAEKPSEKKKPAAKEKPEAETEKIGTAKEEKKAEPEKKPGKTEKTAPKTADKMPEQEEKQEKSAEKKDNNAEESRNE